MRHIIITLIVFMLGAKSHAQTDKLQKQAQQMRAQIDSANARLEQSIQESKRKMDSINLARDLERNQRNLDAFVAMQREREAKLKKQNYIRIGFGVAMLGLLIYGLMRKKKNSNR